MTLFYIPPSSFYFIRHGETDWNAEKRIMGHQDIPLNAKGLLQAHQAVESLQNLGIKRLVSSPLLRARQTADIIKSSLKVPLGIDKSLAEVRWGEREGKISKKEWTRDQWIKGYTPQGAESCDAFQQRVLHSLSKILSAHKKTLIVAHNGVYWAIMDAMGHPNCEALNCVPYVFYPPKSPTHSWLVLPLQGEEQ